MAESNEPNKSKHLQRRLVVAGMAFVAIIASVWNCRYTGHENTRAEISSGASEVHGEAALGGDATPSRPTGLLPTPPPEPSPETELRYADADLRVQHEMAELAMVAALIAATAVVLTGIGIVYIADSLEQARIATSAAVNADKTAREIGEKQTQAYLLCNAGNAQARSARDAVAGKIIVSFPCVLFIKNKGNSPSRDARVNYEITLLRQREDGVFSPIYGKCGNTFCADVGPDDSEVANIDIEVGEVAELNGREIVLIVSGTLFWTNVFDHPQEQPFTVGSPLTTIKPELLREPGQTQDISLHGFGRQRQTFLTFLDDDGEDQQGES